ncbi:MAG: ABC transporter ATP-binding protein [Clostridia bacterium]|nr:ABC transporter ATP-binding protein [Clostridia bacterium]
MAVQKAPKGTLKKVLCHIRRYRLLTLLSLLCALLSSAAVLAVPVLIGRAIDCMIGAGRVAFDELGGYCVQIAVLVGTAAVLQWVMSAVNNRITYQVVRDVRNEAFAHLQTLPLAYLDSHPVGETVSRLIADVDQFADGLLLGFTQLFSGAVTIAGTLGFMLALNWQIAVLVVVLTPLSLFAARFIATRTYRFFRAQSEVRGEQTALIDELIGRQKVVQAFSHREAAQRAFDEINSRLEKTSLKAVFYSSLTNPVTRFVNSMIYAAVALVGAFSVIAGTAGALTVGTLATMLAYVGQYTKPFNEISGVITEFQNALACAGRIFALTEEQPESSDADLPDLADTAGAVTLDGVVFSYSPDKPLIEGLRLDVKPGQHVAIVGPTGCGKTTLINLLMRFYDVNGGSVAVDGRDVRAVTRHSLRSQYGMVLQDTWLKTATVRENLTLGRPDATEEEIVAAAKASHCDGFIRQLPQGYDTVLGEDGGTLSQGQKQLLCIARVMLCLPPMLILDEATSSIDTRTERKIQEAFDKMTAGRTSFIVAHRLSTVREADVILVMRDGHIVEQGDHETLLRQGGFYATLYNSQFAH